MRIGSIGLATVAILPFLVGAALPQQGKRRSLPDIIFAEAKEEHFLGDTMCGECHPSEAASFGRSPHYPYMKDPKLSLDKRGCEGCHGPGGFHLDEENPRVIGYSPEAKAGDVSAACLRCHQDTMKLSHWQKATHGQFNVSCTACHAMHTPHQLGEKPAKPPFSGASGALQSPVYAATRQAKKMLKADEATLCGQCHRQQTAEFRKNSHHPLPEGRVACSDCHDVHPVRSASRKIAVVKDKCVSCHAEVAGPFAFEHDPVAGWTGDGCNECHRSHGSQNPRLLKSFSRGLCAQCHTDKAASHYPGRTCWQAGCHIAVHGSNTDPLLRSR